MEDPDLGPVRMQNVLYRLSDTPGRIRWPGAELGSSNMAILRDELGYSEEQIADLIAKGVVADAPNDDPSAKS